METLIKQVKASFPLKLSSKNRKVVLFKCSSIIATAAQTKQKYISGVKMGPKSLSSHFSHIYLRKFAR